MRAFRAFSKSTSLVPTWYEQRNCPLGFLVKMARSPHSAPALCVKEIDTKNRSIPAPHPIHCLAEVPMSSQLPNKGLCSQSIRIDQEGITGCSGQVSAKLRVFHDAKVRVQKMHPTYPFLDSNSRLRLTCPGTRTGVKRQQKWMVSSLHIGNNGLLLLLDAPRWASTRNRRKGGDGNGWHEQKG